MGRLPGSRLDRGRLACARSRRGWNMTQLLPELRYLPGGLVLDGELVDRREPAIPWSHVVVLPVHLPDHSSNDMTAMAVATVDHDRAMAALTGFRLPL